MSEDKISKRKEWLRQYRQSDEYKTKNRARKKVEYDSAEGNLYEVTRRCDPSIRYSRAKYGAAKRKSGAKAFTLSLEEYTAFISQPCYYCLADISKEKGVGLDRKDNDGGYTADNVVQCCSDCNRRRSKSMSSDEFLRQTILNGRRKSVD